jgi:hypothetical protein
MGASLGPGQGNFYETRLRYPPSRPIGDFRNDFHNVTKVVAKVGIFRLYFGPDLTQVNPLR